MPPQTVTHTEYMAAVKQLDTSMWNIYGVLKSGGQLHVLVKNLVDDLPPQVTDLLMRVGNELMEFVTWIFKQVKETAYGLFSFIGAIYLSNKWVDIRSETSAITGQIDQGIKLKIEDYWQGPVADAYNSMRGPQIRATSRITWVCEQLQDILGILSGAGVGFMFMISSLLADLLKGIVAFIAHLRTGRWVQAVLEIQATAARMVADKIRLTAAITALATLAGLQAQKFNRLRSLLGDSISFDDGKWPTFDRSRVVQNETNYIEVKKYIR